MSSCTKQKRAALMEWKGVTRSLRSKQGSSYDHYSHGPTTQAIESLPTPTPPATQHAAACAAATLPPGGTSSGGAALVPPGLRRSLHAPDLLPLLYPGARGRIDHGQPYGHESAAYARHLGARGFFQLPSRLLETTLVAVASGTDPGRANCPALRRHRPHSPGGRRHRRRASPQEGVR